MAGCPRPPSTITSRPARDPARTRRASTRASTCIIRRHRRPLHLTAVAAVAALVAATVASAAAVGATAAAIAALRRRHRAGSRRRRRRERRRDALRPEEARDGKRLLRRREVAQVVFAPAHHQLAWNGESPLQPHALEARRILGARQPFHLPREPPPPSPWLRPDRCDAALDFGPEEACDGQRRLPAVTKLPRYLVRLPSTAWNGLLPVPPLAVGRPAEESHSRRAPAPASAAAAPPPPSSARAPRRQRSSPPEEGQRRERAAAWRAVKRLWQCCANSRAASPPPHRRHLPRRRPDRHPLR